MLVNHSFTVGNLVPVHKPDLRFVGLAVVPNDVRVARQIEMAIANDGPWGTNDGRLIGVIDYSCPANHPVAVPEPDLRFVRYAVVPKDFARCRAKLLQRKWVVQVAARDGGDSGEVTVDQSFEACEGFGRDLTGEIPEHTAKSACAGRNNFINRKPKLGGKIINE